MNTFVKSKFYSWEIISEIEAIKKVDKSIIISRSSGIPKEIKYFFEVENLEYKKNLQIKLAVREKLFDAIIRVDKLGKCKIFWKAKLGEEIEKNFFLDKKKENIELCLEKNSFEIKFEKINKFLYKLEFKNQKENVIASKDDLSLPSVEEIGEKEGEISYSINKIYERNTENRKKALEIHGTICCICGFDFEKVYGNLGKNYIEIHHIKPLYTLDKSMEINPKIDLVPVCANCHRMIHRNKKEWKSIEEMKRLIKP